MQRPFYNEEQQPFIDKLLATFPKEQLRLLPQIFEEWFEEHDYELNTYYEITEVFNMGIDWPSFLTYNFIMAIYMTDAELQELNEARAEEVRKLDTDEHFDPFNGTHPTNPELAQPEEEDKKDDEEEEDQPEEDLPY